MRPSGAARTSRQTTHAERIVHELTQRIVSTALPPGTLLDETSLATMFGASRTPIREALRQLAAGGLVELRPHQAPRVANADAQRLSEMFDVMAELEALCAIRACAAMTPAERFQLEAHHIEMACHVREGDIAAYRAGNTRFHALIYDGAGNGYLRDLALATRERLAPHRGAQLEAPSRLAESYAEHGEIVTAILRGDAEAAAHAMRRHLRVTRTTLEALSRA